MKPQYEHATHFNRGAALVFSKGNGYLIDKKGKNLLKDNPHDLDTNKRYQFFPQTNSMGLLVTKHSQYDTLSKYPYVEASSPRIRGIMNRKGQWVVEPRACYLMSIGASSIITSTKHDPQEWEFLRLDGRPIFKDKQIPFKLATGTTHFEGAYALVAYYSTATDSTESEYKLAVIDTLGKVLFSSNENTFMGYPYVWGGVLSGLQNGRFLFYANSGFDDTEYVFINVYGNSVSPRLFEASPFSNGLACISKEGKGDRLVFVDTLEQIVISTEQLVTALGASDYELWREDMLLEDYQYDGYVPIHIWYRYPGRRIPSAHPIGVLFRDGSFAIKDKTLPFFLEKYPKINAPQPKENKKPIPEED
jgi:WG containing repeat